MRYARCERLDRLPIAERPYYREVECNQCDGLGFWVSKCFERDPETGECTDCYEHNCAGPYGKDQAVELCYDCDGGRSCIPVSPLERLAECADGYIDTQPAKADEIA